MPVMLITAPVISELLARAWMRHAAGFLSKPADDAQRLAMAGDLPGIRAGQRLGRRFTSSASSVMKGAVIPTQHTVE
jgi:hypothetical protein